MRGPLLLGLLVGGCQPASTIATDTTPARDAGAEREVDQSAAINACEDIDCGSGSCVVERGRPVCSCAVGYRAEGTTCKIVTLETDRCDEDPMAEVSFSSYKSGSFILFYLPKTAAERDLELIVANRQQALEHITQALQITEERTIEIDIAPNRLAAEAHNIRCGVAYPWLAALQVLYLDDPNSYEQKRYGHELMHVLSYNLDPEHRYHLKLVDEGLAEVFDQSGRDQHHELVLASLVEGKELETMLTLGDDDVFLVPSYASYAKAGSFVQQLREIDDDPKKLVAFYRDCRVVWVGDTPKTPQGKLLDAAELTQMIDTALQAHYASSWSQFRAQWLTTLDAVAASSGPRPLSKEDADQIRELLVVRDAALSSGDQQAYRSIKEGFYCDVRVDADRKALAKKMVASSQKTRSTLVETHDLGIQNYRTAIVVFEQDSGGKTTTLTGLVERYPAGWRFRWIDDEW